MYRRFNSGIRVDLHREPLCFAPSVRPEPPQYIYLPLLQDGYMCRPLVKVGFHIRKYEPVAVPDQNNGCKVYSPVSGFVAAIEGRKAAGQIYVPTIVIENDYKDAPFSNVWETDSETSENGLISIARQASIPGNGEHSRPMYKELLHYQKQAITSLVCDITESEPYVISNYRLAVEHADKIVQGFRLAMDACGVHKGYIAVGAEKSEAIKTVSAVLKQMNSEIKLIKTSSKYPASSMLPMLFDERKFGSDRSTSTCGVLSPFSCLSLFDAVESNLPVVSRYVTVAGPAVKKPGVYQVASGTSAQSFLEFCALSPDTKVVTTGGLLSGTAVSDLDFPLLRNIDSVICLTANTEYKRTQDCIHCGKCADVCPANLTPAFLYDYIHKNDLRQAEKLGLRDCLLCGCCSYVCPGRMELTDLIKKGFAMLAKEE